VTDEPDYFRFSRKTEPTASRPLSQKPGTRPLKPSGWAFEQISKSEEFHLLRLSALWNPRSKDVFQIAFSSHAQTGAQSGLSNRCSRNWGCQLSLATRLQLMRFGKRLTTVFRRY
jgi:hypothetical protein